jgi:hypothetical protein
MGAWVRYLAGISREDWRDGVILLFHFFGRVDSTLR